MPPINFGNFNENLEPLSMKYLKFLQVKGKLMSSLIIIRDYAIIFVLNAAMNKEDLL